MDTSSHLSSCRGARFLPLHTDTNVTLSDGSQSVIRLKFKIARTTCSQVLTIPLRAFHQVRKNTSLRVKNRQGSSLVTCFGTSDLNSGDIKAIKKVAEGLLSDLKEQIANIDQWRQRESTRDAVRTTIHDCLWADSTGLPVDTYDEDEINQKTDAVFQHVYRAYPTIPSPVYTS